MTLHDLSQVYYLKSEINYLTVEIELLRMEAESITSAAFTDLPKSKSNQRSIENRIAKIIDYKEKCILMRLQLVDVRNEILEYIDSIDDSQTRQIFKLRFVDCLSWLSVAMSLGGGNTDKSVSQICYRYIAARNRKISHETSN